MIVICDPVMVTEKKPFKTKETLEHIQRRRDNLNNESNAKGLRHLWMIG